MNIPLNIDWQQILLHLAGIGHGHFGWQCQHGGLIRLCHLTCQPVRGSAAAAKRSGR